MPWSFLTTLFQSVDPNNFNNFLLFGYIVMWLVGLAYVISLYSRQRNLKQEIDTLRQLLDEDERA
ncbi:MAG: hypothetical protein KJ063_15985 [Anaerolineae bacterium]|nr:hypothetical protein [Anaerolineae bacterium]